MKCLRVLTLLLVAGCGGGGYTLPPQVRSADMVGHWAGNCAYNLHGSLETAPCTADIASDYHMTASGHSSTSSFTAAADIGQALDLTNTSVTSGLVQMTGTGGFVRIEIVNHVTVKMTFGGDPNAVSMALAKQ